MQESIKGHDVQLAVLKTELLVIREQQKAHATETREAPTSAACRRPFWKRSYFCRKGNYSSKRKTKSVTKFQIRDPANSK